MNFKSATRTDLEGVEGSSVAEHMKGPGVKHGIEKKRKMI